MPSPLLHSLWVYYGSPFFVARQIHRNLRELPNRSAGNLGSVLKTPTSPCFSPISCPGRRLIRAKRTNHTLTGASRPVIAIVAQRASTAWGLMVQVRGCAQRYRGRTHAVAILAWQQVRGGHGRGACAVHVPVGPARPMGPTLQVNSRPDFKRPVHVHDAAPRGEQVTLSALAPACWRSRARPRRRAPPASSSRSTPPATPLAPTRRRSGERRHVAAYASHLLARTGRVVTRTT